MWPRPVALITGASGGLGEALADRLAAAGYDRVLIARRRERLSQVAGRLGARGAAAGYWPLTYLIAASRIASSSE